MKNFKIFEKLRNITSRNLKLIELSHLDARFETPERALTISNHSVGNFKFEKTRKKRQMSKTNKRVEQPQLEARSLAIPESTLTAPNYRALGTSKFEEKQ